MLFGNEIDAVPVYFDDVIGTPPRIHFLGGSYARALRFNKYLLLARSAVLSTKSEVRE